MIVKECRQIQEIELTEFVDGLDVDGYDTECQRWISGLDASCSSPLTVFTQFPLVLKKFSL